MWTDHSLARLVAETAKRFAGVRVDPKGVTYHGAAALEVHHPAAGVATALAMAEAAKGRELGFYGVGDELALLLLRYIPDGARATVRFDRSRVTDLTATRAAVLLREGRLACASFVDCPGVRLPGRVIVAKAARESGGYAFYDTPHWVGRFLREDTDVFESAVMLGRLRRMGYV